MTGKGLKCHLPVSLRLGTNIQCMINNYRPVSVLPIVSKIIEKHVLIHFMSIYLKIISLQVANRELGQNILVKRLLIV